MNLAALKPYVPQSAGKNALGLVTARSLLSAWDPFLSERSTAKGLASVKSKRVHSVVWDTLGVGPLRQTQSASRAIAFGDRRADRPDPYLERTHPWAPWRRR